MQSIKTILTISLLLFWYIVNAQTSYTPLGHKEYNLLDRLDIKTKQTAFGASYLKPSNTRLLVKEVEIIDSLQRNNNRIAGSLSKVDRYNITRFLMTHKEYTASSSSFNNKKTSFNVFEINKPKFFMTVNPAAQVKYGFETDNNQGNYLMSAGLEAKGLIAKKIAFNVFATGNQERTPSYVNAFTAKFHAIPGFSNFKNIDNNAVQYFDVRASASWTLAKFMDMQVGYDRNFIGNGMRSLFLSDFSGNSLFFKSNIRLWKLNFESLYMQLTPQFGIVKKQDYKKYLRINTLSFDATKWLNIGIFDGVVFGRKNQFELNYLLPFTFLRAMEQQSGSPDNAMLGLNVKANIKQRVQVYGQLLLDEFLLSEIKASRGWWANKYGYQLGVKYIDAFNINNLDIQVESNRVRPFTYTHFDSVSNYSNNNMPIAHPLGAGFQEFIVAAKYQPLNKLYIDAKFMYYYQGQDSAGKYMGTNILEDYSDRPFNYGWKIGTGDKATCMYFNVNAAYELKENLFIDAGIVLRNYKLASGYNNSTAIFNVGFRWNITRRQFEF